MLRSSTTALIREDSMRNLRSRLLPALFSVLAVTAAGILAGTGPAAAAPATSGAPAPSTPLAAAPGKTVTHFTTTLTRTTAAGSAAVQAVITCGAFITTPVVQDVPGNLPESTVVARCDAVVDSIDLFVTLRRTGPLVNDVSQQPGSFPFSDNGAVSTSLLCIAIPHSYQGFGYALFQKAGYVGSPLLLSGSTPIVTGTC
jgi:hypothetical protein